MIQQEVKLILDSLNLDPKETYIAVEMGYKYKRTIRIHFYENKIFIYQFIENIHIDEFNSLDLREYLLNIVKTIRNNLLFI
jgi:hypothetical protein